MIEIPSKNDLVEMLPLYFQAIKEYPEIMKAWAEGLDMASASAQQIWDNLYIQTCDLETIEQYEGYLKLNPAPTDPIETRRARVMARLILSFPYSERKLRSIFDDLYGVGGYTLSVDPVTSTVSMTIQSSIPDATQIFLDTWYSMAPAHLAFSVNEDITVDIDSGLYFGGCVTQTQHIIIA